MAEVEDAKKARSKAKKDVTIAVNRLVGACSRSADKAVVLSFATALEVAYEDFLAIHDLYHETVVKETDQEPPDHDIYKETVYKKYEEGQAAYVSYKDDLNVAAAQPLKQILNISMERLKNVIDKAHLAGAG